MQILTTLLFILLAAHVAIGQGAGDSQVETVPEYTFSVVYLSYLSGDALKKRVPGINVKFRSDDTTYHLSAREESISRIFAYRGMDPLVFFKEITGVDGEVINQPLVAAKLGKPGRKLIAIVRNKAGALQAFTFNMKEEDFSPGTLRLLNFSKQSIRGKIDDLVAVVPPMKMHDYAVDGETQKFLASMLLVGDDGEELYLIDKRRVVATKEGRKILFIYPDPKKPQRVTYASYRFESLPDFGNFSDKALDTVDFEAQRKNEWRMGREGSDDAPGG